MSGADDDPVILGVHIKDIPLIGGFLAGKSTVGAGTTALALGLATGDGVVASTMGAGETATLSLLGLNNAESVALGSAIGKLAKNHPVLATLLGFALNATVGLYQIYEGIFGSSKPGPSPGAPPAPQTQ